MADNQGKRVIPRRSFSKYIDPGYIAKISHIQTPVRIDPSSESLELKSKISALENDIREKEKMMTEEKKLLMAQVEIEMRKLHTKIKQAEELLADARIDCVSNVAMKEQNDNLKTEIEYLNEENERMRTDNNKLAKELKKYEPIKGFVCTAPYYKRNKNAADMVRSCTPTIGSPGSFDNVVRNPVVGSRFVNNQPCMETCYTDVPPDEYYN